MADHEGISGPSDRGAARRMTVFGRQGSPTITLALPFSRVDVKADDATPLVSDLAALTARLARVLETAGLPEAITAEVAAIAHAAESLASAAHDPREER